VIVEISEKLLRDVEVDIGVGREHELV